MSSTQTVPQLLSSAGLDTESFLDLVRQHDAGQTKPFFLPDEDLIIARAPGRLDLMGGIADYSGSLVLQWPIREATWTALQRTPERSITVISTGAEANGRDSRYSVPLESLETANGSPLDYASARTLLTSDRRMDWAAYVIGVFVVLMRERGVKLDQGIRLLIASEVPEGKGVSSSAAIEVSVMRAAAEAFGIELIGRDLGLLCQMVENNVVGAPCGVMDQMASACGQANSLMALLCQPAELLGNVALPASLAVWGLDSGVRHSVSGTDYGSVRTAAFMGLTLIERMSKNSFGGYLTRLSPSVFAQHYVAKLPKTVQGSDFLADFGSVRDACSIIRPDRSYNVRAAASHPVNENFRVHAFAEFLKQGDRLTEEGRLLLGELMYQSHASYSACGLGSAATDRLVALARKSGPENGIYGAKITGGGSGGTVAILGRADAQPAIDNILDAYKAETSYRPYLFTGSSDGAVAWGAVRERL